MKEDNPFTSVEPVQPQPITNEVPVQPVEPIQQVVQEPVQPVMQNVGYGSQPPKKKSPAKTILVLLLTVAIIGGASFGGYKYYETTINNKTKDNGTTETTITTESTTTTTQKVVKLLDIKEVSDYINLAKTGKVLDDLVLSFDNDYFIVDYALDKKCKNVGDQISFEDHGLKIEYKCDAPKNPVNDRTDGVVDEWDADVLVNSTYKISKTTSTTCTNWHHFSNGKVFINITRGCGMDTPTELDIKKDDNTVIFNGIFHDSLYDSNFDLDTNRSYSNTPVIIKDNVIYFVVCDKPSETGGVASCGVKYIDLNEKDIAVKEIGNKGQYKNFYEYY